MYYCFLKNSFLVTSYHIVPFVKRCLDAVLTFAFFAFWNKNALSQIQVTVSSLLEMNLKVTVSSLLEMNMKESQPTWFTIWMSVWKFLSRALFGHSMSMWVELCWSGSTQDNKWSSKKNNNNCPETCALLYSWTAYYGAMTWNWE